MVPWYPAQRYNSVPRESKPFVFRIFTSLPVDSQTAGKLLNSILFWGSLCCYFSFCLSLVARLLPATHIFPGWRCSLLHTIVLFFLFSFDWGYLIFWWLESPFIFHLPSYYIHQYHSAAVRCVLCYFSSISKCFVPTLNFHLHLVIQDEYCVVTERGESTRTTPSFYLTRGCAVTDVDWRDESIIHRKTIEVNKQ